MELYFHIPIILQDSHLDMCYGNEFIAAQMYLLTSVLNKVVIMLQVLISRYTPVSYIVSMHTVKLTQYTSLSSVTH